MLNYLLELLRTLESEVPPPPKCHHAITRAHYGSDEKGWVEKLAVQINDGGKFYCFFIDQDDCYKSAVALASEIAEVHAKQLQGAQLGKALGQYV